MATVSWEYIGNGSLGIVPSDAHFYYSVTSGYCFKITVSGLSNFTADNYSCIYVLDTSFVSGGSVYTYTGTSLANVQGGYTCYIANSQVYESATSGTATTLYIASQTPSITVYIAAQVPSLTLWGISSSGSAASGSAAVATTLTATAAKPTAFYFINDGAYPALTTSQTQIRFCRASRWNALVDKINEWWAYKGRSGTSGCSYVSPGTVMLGYYVNQVETALNLLSNWNYFAINSPANTGVALADSWYSLAQTVINGLT